MKQFLTMILVALLAGCASVDYQAYDGPPKTLRGTGGTKVTVDGIDFWANGEPPRDYELMGVADAKIGDGIGAASMIRSAVAAEAKQRGGNAAILASDTSSSAGVMMLGPNVMAGPRERASRYYIIRYR